jgi:hypothetical protein
MVWASLTFITSVSGVSLTFTVLHASGTLKKCKLQAKEHLQELTKGINCTVESSEEDKESSSGEDSKGGEAQESAP